MSFRGASVANITKMKQSDIFRNVHQTVVGTVSVDAAITTNEDVLPMGTLLTSSDGGLSWSTLTAPAYVAGTYQIGDEVYFEGHTFTNDVSNNTAVPTDPSWTDNGEWNANGVLYVDLQATAKATVVVSADVVKSTLSGFDEFLRASLFKNKILVK